MAGPGNGQTTAAALLERARGVLPGGVNSAARRGIEHVYFVRGKGSRIVDVEGVERIDYLLSWGPSILGHAPASVVEAVKRAIDDGVTFGAQHVLELEAAEALKRAIGWADRVRLGTTGSEVVQAAVRIARARTGRDLIVVFAGHYHGWSDALYVSPTVGNAEPGSPGQAPGAVGAVRVLPWNDLDALAETLASNEVAAVLMEPVMLNYGGIMPADGYLQEVRRLTRETGTLLIFDEVITGFRLALGGAAAHFGVTPDLATYAKAMAAGFPAAAIAGTVDVLDHPAADSVVYQGTYNGNRVATAAILATMEALSQPGVYEAMYARGQRLMEGIRAAAAEFDAPIQLDGLPTAFWMSLGRGDGATDHRGASRRNHAAYARFAARLHEAGIWVNLRGNWYLSAAHTDEDIEETLARFRSALEKSAPDLPQEAEDA